MASLMPPFSPITREKNVIPFLALLPSAYKGDAWKTVRASSSVYSILECKVTKKVEYYA